MAFLLLPCHKPARAHAALLLPTRTAPLLYCSLAHPHLDRPPPIEKMLSWSIMTPLYEEDVLYPLSSDAVAKEVSQRGCALLHESLGGLGCAGSTRCPVMPWPRG